MFSSFKFVLVSLNLWNSEGRSEILSLFTSSRIKIVYCFIFILGSIIYTINKKRY